MPEFKQTKLELYTLPLNLHDSDPLLVKNLGFSFQSIYRTELHVGVTILQRPTKIAQKLVIITRSQPKIAMSQPVNQCCSCTTYSIGCYAVYHHNFLPYWSTVIRWYLNKAIDIINDTQRWWKFPFIKRWIHNI